MHLSATYRKTGVRRAELGTWLATRADSTNPMDTARQN
jgi:hypothetical protein